MFNMLAYFISRMSGEYIETAETRTNGASIVNTQGKDCKPVPLH